MFGKPNELRDAVVVVTGASGGVGRATARLLGERGATVALLARGERGLNAAAEDVETAGGRALPITVDMADPRAVDATLKDLTTTTAKGSTVILTYVDRAALGSDSTWHQEVAKVGEPWTFGLHPADVPGYLAARGLELKGDLSTKDVAARYHRDEPAADFYRVAWAVVR